MLFRGVIVIMKRYNCILFDLDGTLVNTFSGIMQSYQYAARKMKLQIPTEDFVNEVIGAPLTQVFAEKYNLDEYCVKKAVDFYREEYAKNGIFGGEVYTEIRELLQYLNDDGFKIGVTTLKNEEFAKRILENMGIAQYMDIILGMDGDDKLTKAKLIDKAIKCLAVNKNETVLVGDSLYDAEGAKEAEISFIGVTYGFGFKNVEDIYQYKGAMVARTPLGIIELVGE